MRYIYIYIYVKGHVAEWAPSHTQSVRGLKEKRFKLQELGKKGLSCGSQEENVQLVGLAAYCNYFFKKRDIERYIVFLELKQL